MFQIVLRNLEYGLLAKTSISDGPERGRLLSQVRELVQKSDTLLAWSSANLPAGHNAALSVARVPETLGLGLLCIQGSKLFK